jgi:hypothetical protein
MEVLICYKLSENRGNVPLQANVERLNCGLCLAAFLEQVKD